jgi:hypothetical protein
MMTVLKSSNNNMKRLIFPFITILILLLASCYYDNEEALYPSLNFSCDTTNVTYSGSVVTMLANNCLSCHSNVTAVAFGGNVALQNYADVVLKADRIAGSIKQLPTFKAMPKNGGKIKDCLITQFDIWVRKGKLNN